MKKRFALLCSLAGFALWSTAVPAQDAATPFQGLTQPPSAHPTGESRDKVVDRASPTLKLKDLDGKKVSLESFKGKVVIVDFWATWCVPCKTEIPGYIELQKKYGADGLVILGVSLDSKKPAAVKRFADEMGMNYTLAIGTIEDVDKFKSELGPDVVLPTTFLINRAGRIIHEKQGQMEHAKYEALVKAAL